MSRARVFVGLGLLAAAGAGVALFFSGALGAPEADCTLKGSGLVDCTVANHGIGVARPRVTLQLGGGNVGFIEPGAMWPGQSVSVLDRAPFMYSPVDWCGKANPRVGITDWRQLCVFSVSVR